MSTNPDENLEAESPQYASLTAGLLARKGEALPAAAAFTAEAIAQHIPARRLALEVERENQNSIFQQSQAAKSKEPEMAQETSASEMTSENSEATNIKEEIDDFIVSALGTQVTPEPDEGERDPNVGGSMDERASFIERALTGNDGDAGVETPSKDAEVSKDLRFDESDLNRFNTIVDEAIAQARPAEKRFLFGKSLGKKVWSPSKQPKPIVTDPEAKPSEQSSIESEQKSKKGCSVDERVATEREAIKTALSKSANASMRLDPRRYIRLNVAAAKLELSNQQVLSAALDAYLDSLDTTLFNDCACMKKGII